MVQCNETVCKTTTAIDAARITLGTEGVVLWRLSRGIAINKPHARQPSVTNLLTPQSTRP